MKWYQKKFQSLTPFELLMFIASRIFISFGAGVLAMRYIPDMVAWSGLPALVVGFVLLVLAGKGSWKKSPD